MKIMVIEPGPNNGTIGCGGSILKHVEQGNQVHLVSLTHGDAPTADFTPPEFMCLREKEAVEAANVLGIVPERLHFLGHRVFGISVEEAIQEIINLLRKIRPDVCYIPSPEGNHPDYAATHQAATRALSFSGGKWFKQAGRPNQESWNVPTVLIYEVEVPLGSPSYYEDVSEYAEKKKEALAVHASQTASRQHDESSHYLNRFRGIMSRKGFACEAFEVWRAETLF